MEKKKFCFNLLIFLSIFLITLFFALFLVRQTYQYKIDTIVANDVVLKLQFQNEWGLIPGKLNYNMDQSLSFYNLTFSNSSDSNHLTYDQCPSLHIDMKRNFTNAKYITQESAISYEEDFSYHISHPAEILQKNVTNINLAALSTWYQLANRPNFWLAYKALV